MAGSHAKITEDGFKIGIGFMLAVAVSLAIGRIFIRVKLNNRIYVDDGFFLLAVVVLIAGTVMTYIDIPYIYLQQDVQAGIQAPPADFVQQLLKSVKIQDAAVVLLSTGIFAIKLSFLALFRSLIRRLKKIEMWWWFVLTIVIPSSVVLICSNFITCGYFDERILGTLQSRLCVTAGALKRQTAALQAVTILDILSDVLIITIPVALLWRVQIDMRRKLVLGTMLCLSIFTIITAIVRVSGGKSANGQIDSSWVIFWLHIETAVAVMVASISAYRALFVVERSRHHETPRYISRLRAKLWERSKDSHETRNNNNNNKGLPSIPAPTLSGMQTFINHAPYGDERSMKTDESSPSRQIRSAQGGHCGQPATSYEMV
ncbi:MAG: hypothetical protein Q9220_004357 [cf. Caloplaca sp. 1 TL-2023]